MTINTLPTAPLRTMSPADFVAAANTFLAALPTFSSQVNSDLAALLTLSQLVSTSTTSLTIGTGSKSLTVQTSKAYLTGQTVRIYSTATPDNYMDGTVTSYDSGTGALVVNVTTTNGSGTLAAWTVILNGGLTTTVDLNAAVALRALLAGSASQVFSVAAATADAHAIGAKQLQTQAATAFTTGGTSTAFTLTTTNAPALTTGERWYVTFNVAAGATPTLNRDSKGAKSLKYRDSAGAKQAITSTQVPSGWSSDVVYDGTDYIVLEVVWTHAPDYVSSDQTITSAARLTLAHGLGMSPSFVEIELVCQSTDQNWAANDVISVAAFGVNTGGSGLALHKDTTNIYIGFANIANAFAYLNKTTGTVANLDNTKWKLRVKAWR